MEKEEIRELWSGDFPDTKEIPSGYDWTSIPEATPSNMVILVDKINELIEIINKLK